MTHTITPTSSLGRPLAQPAMSQMLVIPDSLCTEVEAAGIDATRGSNAAKRGDASSGFAMVKKQKVTGGMSAEKKAELAAAKGAADCVKRLLAQLEQRANAAARESKAVAKAAKARDTHIGKAAKKVAAAAIAAVKARYAAPVRTSGRARVKSEKAQGAEFAAFATESKSASRKHATIRREPSLQSIERGDRRAIAATLEFQKKPLEERKRLALTAEEAIARAAEEGLPLVRLAGTKTGFKSVYIENGNGPLGYVARLWLSNDSGGKITLGTYATAEEAALNYARCLGRDAAIAAVDGIQAELFDMASASLTIDDVKRQAAAEGLELIRSAKCKAGFEGVVEQRNGWFGAQHAAGGKTIWLGNFRLREQAALAYARFKAGAPNSRPSNSNARRAIAAVHGAHLRATGELAPAEVEVQAFEDDGEDCGAMLVDPIAVREV